MNEPLNPQPKGLPEEEEPDLLPQPTVNKVKVSKYITPSGSVVKKINRETIMPQNYMEKKREDILENETSAKKKRKASAEIENKAASPERLSENQASNKTCCCFSWFRSSKFDLFKKIRKRKGADSSIINILEYLYLTYDNDMVNMLWQKPINPAKNPKPGLRDDLSDLLLQISNYWLSFNEHTEDNFAQILMVTTSMDNSFFVRLFCFIMANYFEGEEFQETNKIIQKKLKKLIETSWSHFSNEKFIRGLSQLSLMKIHDKIHTIFKIYSPLVDSNVYNWPYLSKEVENIESNPGGPISGQKDQFFSTICLLNDIVAITRKVDHSKTKSEKMKEIKTYLNMINTGLPSFVSIPTDDSSLQRLIIARINFDETKIFQTKTKTNFSCCFELISPEEYLMKNYYPHKNKREKVIKTTLAKIEEKRNKRHENPLSLLKRLNRISSKDPKQKRVNEILNNSNNSFLEDLEKKKPFPQNRRKSSLEKIPINPTFQSDDNSEPNSSKTKKDSQGFKIPKSKVLV